MNSSSNAPEQVKDYLRKNISYVSDPKVVLINTADALNAMKTEGDSISEEKLQEYSEKLRKFSLMDSIKSKSLLIESISVDHRSFALEMCRELEEEYSASSPSVITCIQNIVLNYIRVMNITHKLNNELDKTSYSDLSCKYSDTLSRELDRAQRHYQSSLQLLKQLKAPEMNIQINAQNAIVGHNQQLNSNCEKVTP
ncbi:MAG: hypothetical protein P1V18_00680 [Candidatus Gracilibacteria bacterium]|nr:hypothetical protein [Candidatus Gracilibacteria bacterium]